MSAKSFEFSGIAPIKWLWCAVLLVVLWPAEGDALAIDKEQPLIIEAGQATLDNQQRVAIYKTEVVITQGSLRLKGDRATVHYSVDNGIERLILEGSPAAFRQLAEDQSRYYSAHADRMEYTVDSQTIVLLGNANYTDSEYTVSADRISYNIDDGHIKAGLASAESQPESPASPPEGQRVRVTIQPPQEKSP